MKHIIIERNEEVTRLDGFKIQTIGKLCVYTDGMMTTKLFECKTLEKGWVDNKRNVSCIPPEPDRVAVYMWEKMKHSPLFSYPHIWIRNVPNRTHIKIHIGNRYDEIKGCVLVGMEYGYLPNDDVIDVIRSREAMEGLMNALDDDPKGTLEIISRVNSKHRTHCKEHARHELEYNLPTLTDLDIDLNV